jgi:hypothetical protein
LTIPVTVVWSVNAGVEPPDDVPENPFDEAIEIVETPLLPAE